MFPQITESLAPVSAEQWNRLRGPDHNPFLRHEFLFGLEKTGCASPAHGWSGQHVLLWEKPGNGGNLLGAVPMYRKAHSWGEYVFDHEWARAWQRAGFLYYPKLSVCVPFTPATGPRLLIRNQQDADAVRQRLIKAAIDHARALGVSSLHWLFTDEADTQALETAGLLRRTGFQYHWRNRGFADFDDFLASLSSKKRKNIRRERRRVAESGVTITRVNGAEMTDADWRQFYAFYLDTIDAHGAMPYLNLEFFRHLGQTMADDCFVIFAENKGRTVAGALFLQGADTLYGRYWGCAADFHSLHFELCYYQAIEYCINNGLRRFEAGAQGHHKLARGLEATPTWSAHWIADPGFRRAIAGFLEAESHGVEQDMQWLGQRSPYKSA